MEALRAPGIPGALGACIPVLAHTGTPCSPAAPGGTGYLSSITCLLWNWPPDSRRRKYTPAGRAWLCSAA